MFFLNIQDLPNAVKYMIYGADVRVGRGFHDLHEKVFS